MIQISYIKPDGNKYCQFVYGRRAFVKIIKWLQLQYDYITCKYYSCY